jgi:hypothetical protein
LINEGLRKKGEIEVMMMRNVGIAKGDSKSDTGEILKGVIVFGCEDWMWG